MGFLLDAGAIMAVQQEQTTDFPIYLQQIQINLYPLIITRTFCRSCMFFLCTFQLLSATQIVMTLKSIFILFKVIKDEKEDFNEEMSPLL
jgi:hypothetical protein